MHLNEVLQEMGLPCFLSETSRSFLPIRLTLLFFSDVATTTTVL